MLTRKLTGSLNRITNSPGSVVDRESPDGDEQLDVTAFLLSFKRLHWHQQLYPIYPYSGTSYNLTKGARKLEGVSTQRLLYASSF